MNGCWNILNANGELEPFKGNQMVPHKLLLDLPSRLETNRLFLRPYAPGDGALLYQVGERNLAHLQRYESGNSLLSLHSVEEGEILARELALAFAARSYFMWGVFEKTGGAFVAQVYVGAVRWEVPDFEIGYIADCEHEGQGYVTEAVRVVLGFVFNDLGAHRASLYTATSNTRSQRVAERCGFVLEGHIREDFPAPDGTLFSSLHYGMLRREWETQS
jgi:RimJ/RimL family protein N-acetyltransferase